MTRRSRLIFVESKLKKNELAMNSAQDVIIIPRPFKLRLEYDAASGKKSKTYLTKEHENFISYGLHQMTPEQKEDPNFDCMGYWQGMIIGIQNMHCGEVMYSWVAKMPQNYPYAPPMIRFVTKIALPCVDDRGFVNVNAIPNFKWDPTMNLANVLMALRDAMKHPEYAKKSYSLIGKQFFQEYPASQVERNFIA